MPVSSIFWNRRIVHGPDPENVCTGKWIPASQVASIVCQLPDPICDMLKREPRFALICQMAEEQYAYLYKPSGQPEKEDAGEKCGHGKGRAAEE